MHPVKAEEAIAEAYFGHGVRTFSLDTLEELDKIVRATSTDGVAASDLNLLVRIRVSSDHAKLSLASKFGADPRDVSALLMAARQAADALGICFHVGSQAMTPGGFCRSDGRASATPSSRPRSRSTSSTSVAAFRPPIRAWSRRRSRPISRSSTRRSKRCRSAIRPILARAGPRALRGICERPRPRREAPRRRTLHQRRRIWRALRRCAYRLALSGPPRPRPGIAHPPDGSSASTARPATISTAWPARSSCPPTWASATISKSECSAPTVARCAPNSTASALLELVVVEDEPTASLYGASAPAPRSNVVQL